MTPLLDVLVTRALPAEPETPGRYDARRGLRVDEAGQPIVASAATALSTQTRAGVDRDDAPRAVGSLGTVTKATSDHDETAAHLSTKTSAGRDTDDPLVASLLLGTVTFAGPDRD